MRKFLLSILLCVSVFPLFAQSSDSGSQSCVYVNGTAQMEVEPNEIWLSVTLTESDSKDKTPLKVVEEKMLRALKAAGIDTGKSLFVEDLSASPYRKVHGVLSRSYLLELSSAGKVYEVFDIFDKIGIHRVAVSKVTRDDLPALRSRLRVQAVQSARDKAVELAGAVGQTVGKAFYIQDINYDSMDAPTRYRQMDVENYKEGTQESLPVPEFKKIRLHYSVNAKFILE